MNRNVLRDRILRDGRHQPGGGAPSPDAGADRSPPANHEALIAAVAQEIGGTVEAAVGLVIDRGQDVVLSVLGKMPAASTPGRWPELLSVTRERSAVVSRASGTMASASSRWAMRTGLSLLQKAHQALASKRTQAETPQ